MNKLNGWNRLAVVVIGVWLTGTFAIAGIEIIRPKSNSGVFVTVGPPDGSIFSQGFLKLQDGTSIDLADKSADKPWDVDWTKELNVPLEYQVNHFAFITAIASPILIWISLTLLARSLNWVREGFLDNAS